MRGTICKVDVRGGFAFVRSVGKPRDAFLHARNLSAELSNSLLGRTVEYVRHEGERGPHASDAQLIESKVQHGS